MASNTKKITVDLTVDKVTKGTKRFAEDASSTGLTVLGSQYIQKSALGAIGDPERIRITIEPLGN